MKIFLLFIIALLLAFLFVSDFAQSRQFAAFTLDQFFWNSPNFLWGVLAFFINFVLAFISALILFAVFKNDTIGGLWVFCFVLFPPATYIPIVMFLILFGQLNMAGILLWVPALWGYFVVFCFPFAYLIGELEGNDRPAAKFFRKLCEALFSLLIFMPVLYAILDVLDSVRN